MVELKTIFISVFSGVVTSALLYWFSITVKRILIPAYQRMSYKGIDVSGEWTGEWQHSKPLFFSFSLSLQQNAHDLKGSFNILKTIDGKQEKITNMKVEGEIWEGFISLKCRTVSNKELSFGSALLKVNASELDGKYIFRNLVKAGEEIGSFNLKFSRVHANA
ncbi:hypothetical protein BCU94_18845 [Shewanella sp. 10N.286.52.C2]|uniref:hypothetical protein n=1 Tax=Shewanella sp. 10N.286.52.C2 TaxID=1880838 RepID=UPI000C823D82|nr:hypothetical protein [Shewanella sp. 10N.286.52.C2]PMG27814.1 hypothetical protein BCU94_18845 [Shewanella sp. 10N.286.52.C2]